MCLDFFLTRKPVGTFDYFIVTSTFCYFVWISACGSLIRCWISRGRDDHVKLVWRRRRSVVNRRPPNASKRSDRRSVNGNIPPRSVLSLTKLFPPTPPTSQWTNDVVRYVVRLIIASLQIFETVFFSRLLFENFFSRRLLVKIRFTCYYWKRFNRNTLIVLLYRLG